MNEAKTVENEVEVPALIAEACQNCLQRDHPHPLIRCMAHEGYFPPAWASLFDVTYRCLSYNPDRQTLLNRYRKTS